MAIKRTGVCIQYSKSANKREKVISFGQFS